MMIESIAPILRFLIGPVLFSLGLSLVYFSELGSYRMKFISGCILSLVGGLLLLGPWNL